VQGAAGETWRNIDFALYKGLRGLPRRSSLAKLHAERRKARNRTSLPRLTETQIRQWTQEHRRRTGKWSTIRSRGSIAW